jgi:hypothetical protein
VRCHGVADPARPATPLGRDHQMTSGSTVSPRSATRHPSASASNRRLRSSGTISSFSHRLIMDFNELAVAVRPLCCRPTRTMRPANCGSDQSRALRMRRSLRKKGNGSQSGSRRNCSSSASDEATGPAGSSLSEPVCSLPALPVFTVSTCPRQRCALLAAASPARTVLLRTSVDTPFPRFNGNVCSLAETASSGRGPRELAAARKVLIFHRERRIYRSSAWTRWGRPIDETRIGC